MATTSMPTISAPGIGSGLDVNSIVSQLMQIESQPLTALQTQATTYQAELSAYGKLKSAISTFQTAMQGLSTADKFKIFSTASSDETVVTATADSAAAAGTFNIGVSRLAQNHKLGSDPFASTDTFGGGAGDAMTLTVGSNAMTVDLSGAMTLSQIRDTINNATDNPGVTASLFNANGQQRLILTAQESGYDNRVQVSYGGSLSASTFNFANLNQDAGGAVITDLTQLDASLTVDGFAVTSASNQVSGVTDGVDFTLTGLGSSTVTISRDTASIEKSAQGFVDAYNALTGVITDLQSGDLSGDSTLRSLQAQLRGVLNTSPTGLNTSMTSLSQVGILTERDGTLSLNTTTFDTALNTDFSGVSELFSASGQGFAARFDTLAGNLLDTEGLVSTREDTLNTQIKDNQTQQTDMQAQLALKEQDLRNQYAALDSLIGSMQQTSTYLTQALSKLPG